VTPCGIQTLQHFEVTLDFIFTVTNRNVTHIVEFHMNLEAASKENGSCN